MASHELRTPLNAIIGFSEVLASEAFGPLGAPQYREYAGIIRSSGRELLHLVNQILEIARLEGGAADLTPRAEPLGPSLAEAVAAILKTAATKGVRIESPSVENLPSVRADARALATMLSALLEHAVAFSPSGGTVTVAVKFLLTRTVVEIADQGPSCHADDLDRLTRPFESGEAPARKAPGAGLALPIARLLAEASGGSLRLRSDAGSGVTAVLSLPRA